MMGDCSAPKERPTPVARHLSLLYRYTQRYFSLHLRPFPLDAGQLPFLLQLYRRPNSTQEQLSQYLALDKGTTARGIALLLQNQLVLRQEDARDRRAYRLSPSPQARDLEEQLCAIPQALQEILYQGMSQSEQEQAFGLICRMGENIEAYFKGQEGRFDPKEEP